MADSRLRGYRQQHPCTENSTYKDSEAGAKQALDIPEREEKSGGGGTGWWGGRLGVRKAQHLFWLEHLGRGREFSLES